MNKAYTVTDTAIHSNIKHRRRKPDGITTFWETLTAEKESKISTRNKFSNRWIYTGRHSCTTSPKMKCSLHYTTKLKRYAGAKPFWERWTVTAIWNWMRSGMSNQCSSIISPSLPICSNNCSKTVRETAPMISTLPLCQEEEKTSIHFIGQCSATMLLITPPN